MCFKNPRPQSKFAKIMWRVVWGALALLAIPFIIAIAPIFSIMFGFMAIDPFFFLCGLLIIGLIVVMIATFVIVAMGK